MSRGIIFTALPLIAALVLGSPALAGESVVRAIEDYEAGTPAWQKVAELEPGSVVVYPEGDGSSYGAADQRWNFVIAPYVWVPGMDGTVGVKGRKASVDSSVSDTIDTLTDSLDAVFTLHVELWDRNWGGWLDINFFSLEGEKNGRITSVEAEVSQTMVEAAVAYRFDMGNGWLIEPFAGLRYTNLEIDLEIAVVGQPLFDRDGDEGWLDPIIGVRTRVPVADWLSLRLRGDIGGFGVGSDFTWSITAGANFHVCSWFSFFLGWKWLDIDYEDGSGSSKFRYDVLNSGPLLGLLFTF